MSGSRVVRSMIAGGVFALVFAAGGVEGQDNYKKGDLICNDFQNSERNYKSDPTGGYATDYAWCLIVRGGEDLRAISILEDERDVNNVGAAHLLALYIATGGTMKHYQLDKNNYDKAFHAYAQTLHLINHQPDYPEGFWFSEDGWQHELTAYRYMVYISYNRYIDGLNASTNSRLLQSPTYQGNRDKEYYPQYSPYTLNSLAQTIEQAGICANLPLKPHFQPKRYRQTIEYCRVSKRIAEELSILEGERLTLLNDENCARDINKCSEYDKLLLQGIKPLAKEQQSESSRIWELTPADQ